MSRLIKKWPLSPTHEIIWMGFVGMGLTAIEESCVDLQQSLYYIWTQTFPYDKFSAETQGVIKSILCGIVLARSVTVHLYFFSYFAMLMMAIFEEVPFLALPWLVVSLIRNFLLDTLAFLSGVFVCIQYALAPVCYEFIIYKICEMGVSVYLWLSVLKLCQDISFPDINPGDLVLTRAECIPRRAKQQELAEEVGVSQELGKEEEEEEEEEEVGEDDEEDGDDDEDEEADGASGGTTEMDAEEGESEDEGVQVSTLSRKFLNQEAQKLGYIPELDERKPETEEIEESASEDEEVQVNTISEKYLEEASEKQGEISDNAEELVAVDEDEGMKTEGIQVDTLSKEFLDQAEEFASNEKLSIEIQVNTVSYSFLNEEAEKMGMAPETRDGAPLKMGT